MSGKAVAVAVLIGLVALYFMYSTQKQLNFMINQIKIMDQHWRDSNEAVNGVLNKEIKINQSFAAKQERLSDYFVKNPKQNQQFSPELQLLLAQPPEELDDAA